MRALCVLGINTQQSYTTCTQKWRQQQTLTWRRHHASKCSTRPDHWGPLVCLRLFLSSSFVFTVCLIWWFMCFGNFGAFFVAVFKVLWVSVSIWQSPSWIKRCATARVCAHVCRDTHVPNDTGCGSAAWYPIDSFFHVTGRAQVTMIFATISCIFVFPSGFYSCSVCLGFLWCAVQSFVTFLKYRLSPLWGEISCFPFYSFAWIYFALQ